MTFISRSFDELNNVSVNALITLGYTDAQFAGTGIRTIIEQTNAPLSQFYIDSQLGLASNTLSQASTEYLSDLGQLVGLPRYNGESDNNYRVRLTQNRQLAALGTTVSMVVPILSLIDVRDVIIKNYIYGLGSIGLYLVGVQGLVSNDTISTAQQMVRQVCAAGATFFILTPELVTVNVSATISPNTAINPNDNASLQGLASAAIIQYMSSLTMGAPLVIAKMTQAVLDSSSSIKDFAVLSLSITNATTGNSQELLLQDYVPKFNQQVQAGIISVI